MSDKLCITSKTAESIIKVAACDIETNGLLPECDTFWTGAVVCMESGRVTQTRSINEYCETLDTYETVIFHNGLAFDIPALQKFNPGWIPKARVVDTLLLSWLLRPERKTHNLQDWGESLGIPKPTHEEWDKWSPEMDHRCRMDAIITAKLARLLDWKTAPGSEVLHYIWPKLLQQEQRGWMMEAARAAELRDKMAQRRAVALKEIMSHLPWVVENHGEVRRPFKMNGKPSQMALRWAQGGYPYPPYQPDYERAVESLSGPFTRVSFRKADTSSNVEMKEYLLAHGWKPEQWNMKDGGRTSPKLTKHDPFVGVEGPAKLIVEIRNIDKMDAFVRGWESNADEQNILHPRVVGLAVTSRARHSVVANVPRVTTMWGKEIRELLVPRPGNVMVGIDAVACQFRMLASRMNDPEYTEVVLKGDVHDYHQRAAGFSSRDNAKTGGYAYIFGAGNAKLGSIENASAERGLEIKQNLEASIPALKRVQDELRQEWRTTAKVRANLWGGTEFYGGIVKGLDGRPILVDSDHKLLMGALQSDEAILMQYAMQLLHQALQVRGFYQRAWQLIWYHDEWQWETTPALADTIGKLGCWAVHRAGQLLGLNCPQAGEYRVGKNWAETH